MSTVWKGITNGGANRFFEKNGELMVAGADVAGRQKVDVAKIIELWEPTNVSGFGNVTDDLDANPRVNQDGFGVRISGAGVGGNWQFTFATEKAATQFEAFLEELGDKGYLADIF